MRRVFECLLKTRRQINNIVFQTRLFFEQHTSRGNGKLQYLLMRTYIGNTKQENETGPNWDWDFIGSAETPTSPALLFVKILRRILLDIRILYLYYIY